VPKREKARGRAHALSPPAFFLADDESRIYENYTVPAICITRPAVSIAARAALHQLWSPSALGNRPFACEIGFNSVVLGEI